jgi:hypothetical protein
VFPLALPIAGAVHAPTPDEVAALLAAPPGCSDHSVEAVQAYWQQTALIFHCEFSSERGPRAAKWVRNQVRRCSAIRSAATSQQAAVAAGLLLLSLPI